MSNNSESNDLDSILFQEIKQRLSGTNGVAIRSLFVEKLGPGKIRKLIGIVGMEYHDQKNLLEGTHTNEEIAGFFISLYMNKYTSAIHLLDALKLVDCFEVAHALCPSYGHFLQSDSTCGASGTNPVPRFIQIPVGQQVASNRNAQNPVILSESPPTYASAIEDVLDISDNAVDRETHHFLKPEKEDSNPADYFHSVDPHLLPPQDQVSESSSARSTLGPDVIMFSHYSDTEMSNDDNGDNNNDARNQNCYVNEDSTRSLTEEDFPVAKPKI